MSQPGSQYMKEKCGTLLVAERGGELAQSLNFWVTEQGHRLKSVDNIKDLLMTLQNEKIHVLVMDVRLPKPWAMKPSPSSRGWTASCPSSLLPTKITPNRKAASGNKGIFYYHVNSFGIG